MGYYDGSPLRLWKLARQYTLADNFFHGGHGGSFLNHFWLVCACTPELANPPASIVSSSTASGTRLKPAAEFAGQRSHAAAAVFVADGVDAHGSPTACTTP